MSDPRFQVERSTTAYVLVRATAAIDARTAAALRTVCAQLLREGRHFIALDVAESAVYGPQGFSTLIGLIRACRDRGGQLYLLGACATARRIVGYGPSGPGRSFRNRAELDGYLFARPADRQVRGG